ncbi:MAG: hypothetical protein RIB41_09590 [Oceanibaculum nanhaiense]|uniref:hypothetical protein n=1 Tax=Oceanibaculum nanhaiense TaxID=1909734 RepID=UPI0032ED1183
MDYCGLYAELKGWQGAIGSVLGFIALICGALFNFHLNRRRDQQLRNEEVVAIASALYGEIVILRRSVARMANAVGARYIRQGLYSDGAIDKHFIEQFSLPAPKLYAALANKVGMLDSQLALGVVLFYSRVEEVEIWLPRLQEDQERPFTYGVNYVLNPAIDAVIQVSSTLRVIEEMAGFVEKVETPNLEKAIEAQDCENMRNEA